MSFFEELKRRNVFRVGIAYVLLGWVVLQAADFALDLIDAPNWTIQALFIAGLAGLPIALFFAWAFELTPEGVKRERDVDRSTSITNTTGRKLDRTIIVFLALGIGYLLVDKLVLQGKETAPTETAQQQNDVAQPAISEASVAVLPFANMSNDPDNEYFSDGLTDTLLHMLAQIPDLRVAARTSSFAFKGQSKGVPEIARELGVANILEGSVQRANDQVRVTAQLIRAEDGFHIWSQTYTRPLQDIFAIQDEIATDVAGALGTSLLGEDAFTVQGVATKDLTAFDRYLKGLEQQAIFSYGSLEAAEDHFEQALAQDPEFTDARLALALNYIRKHMTGMITRQEVQRFAQPLTQQVLEQHPENKLAQSYQGMLESRFNDQLRTREEIRANVYRNRDLLAFLPTETFIRTSVAGGLHFMLDESEAALEVLDAGMLIDPLDPDLHMERGRILFDLDQLDGSETAIRRAIELAPENPTGYGMMADIATRRGNLPAYMDWIRQAMELDPRDHELPFEIAASLYALELTEEAEPFYARVQALAPGSSMARLLEVMRASERDQVEQAVELARLMISDQVDNRRGSFWWANLYFTDNMMEADRAQEAFDFLLQVRPEVADWGAESPDFRVEVMKRFAIMLMTGFASFEERQLAWNTYVEAAEARGFPIVEEGTGTDVLDAIINGDVGRAVTVQVEQRMTDPVAYALWRHRPALATVYEPVFSDPRYMAALDARKRDVEVVREQVVDLLLTPEWNE